MKQDKLKEMMEIGGVIRLSAEGEPSRAIFSKVTGKVIKKKCHRNGPKYKIYFGEESNKANIVCFQVRKYAKNIIKKLDVGCIVNISGLAVMENNLSSDTNEYNIVSDNIHLTILQENHRWDA